MRKIISVIIPCFNAQGWIKEAIESVLGQGIDDLEIIVVDDGSTDKSAEVIQENFPSIKLIRTKNQGPSKARNLGTGESKGEFIQYLDADDVLAPGKLKIQLEALGVSGADVAYGDWQKLTKTKDNKYVKADIVKATRKLQDPEIDLFTDCWCPVDSYLYRRTIIERVGGWNEGLPVIQDARLAIDCALHGAKFIYCAGLMVYVRWAHSLNSVSQRDPQAFNRDIFKNASEIEEWWERHGGITEGRKKALLKVYGYVARTAFRKDNQTFESAYQALKRLSPGYLPERPGHLRLVSRLTGYKKAEDIAFYYRRVKSWIFR